MIATVWTGVEESDRTWTRGMSTLKVVDPVSMLRWVTTETMVPAEVDSVAISLPRKTRQRSASR